MHWTPWQIILLVGIVIVGSQTPMFVLASSIDSDEAAKSVLGAFSAVVFSGILAFVLKISGSKKD